MTTTSEFTPEYQYVQSRYKHWAAKGFNPKAALDIGACKAQWTNVIRSVWPTCEMTLVEADQRCKAALDPLSAHHEIHMIPLSKDGAKRPFHLRKGEDVDTWGSSSFYLENTAPFQQDFRTVMVETKRMDDLFAGREFDLIKLDTQGSEIDILEGGKSVWTKAQLIQIEISFVPYNKGAPIFHNYIEYMARHGFHACDVLQLHFMSYRNNVTETIQEDLLFCKGIPSP